MTNKIEILKDLANRKLNITRAFNAPVEKVWKAWTDSSLLEKWWAPRPWRAITKTMDFSEGGHWLYCMAGPNGEKAWCLVNYKAIDPQKSFTNKSDFCDENGNIDASFPSMNWLNKFKSTNTGCMMEITLSFDKEGDLEKIIEMGFEGGFTMGLNNLDELLEA
jgi:uncharacterized protein YndB with AHSA1/START domain